MSLACALGWGRREAGRGAAGEGGKKDVWGERAGGRGLSTGKVRRMA